MNIDTLHGQLSGGDIHNNQSVDSKVNTAQQINGAISGDVAGGDIYEITSKGAIHIHLTLQGAEALPALVEMLRLAISAKKT
ncbi:MAG TPA: hypothetical protein PLU47_14315 [Azonexus sp.]|nr:hypothetical protein [Verrucomicrobiota bacterium]HQU80632.1 hypothetical protein [Azonexus sp.]